MKSIGQKMIFISFLLAILVAASVFMYLNSLKSSKKVVSETTILVASKTIPSRTLIDKSMLKEIKVSSNPMFNNYINDSLKIIGKYTKETILTNEGFLKEKLIDDKNDDLSTKMAEEHRAISIALSLDSGVSKLIRSGDYVDVIVYLPERIENQVIVRPDISKIILENIEVIAVDQKTIRSDKSDEKEKIAPNFLVTLSVKTEDVEKIVLSEKIGSITLALRPIKSENVDETDGTIWQELISSNYKDKNNNDTNDNHRDDNYTSYTIKKGDTLRKISEAFYGDSDKYEVIKESNNIENEDVIMPGVIIKIPKGIGK